MKSATEANATTIVGVIEHYQRSIERCHDDEIRLLHCINKLYRLPIKVEHLQETGIGKTVNSLRKFNGEIGVAAKALVTKWKAMVAAEEEPLDTNCQTNEDKSNINGDGEGDGDTSDDESNRKSTTQGSKGEQRQQDQKSCERSANEKEKDKHKHKSRENKGSIGGASERDGGGSSHHNEKLTGSVQEFSTLSRHKSDKRDNEKHHKSRDRTEKSERKDIDKERERNDKRKDERKEVKESEKKSSSSSSLSHHHKSSSSSSSKRKAESSNDDQQHSTKEKESSKHKDSEKSSSSKDKDKPHVSKKSKDDKHDSGKPSLKDKESRDKHRSTSSSSSLKPSTSAAASASNHNAERKRRHNSDNDSDDSKSPKAKAVKVQKVAEEKTSEEVDGIDSSMGANFADVLGMLNMPTKKSKKSQQSNSKSPMAVVAASTSSSTSKNVMHSKESPIRNVASTSKINGVRQAPSSTRYSPDAKPDLLSSSANLAPLDPSIALELPTISTNYKPMPLNQTVMDCVFNTSSSSASRAPVRTLTDAEAFGHGISSKTMRTKIYSGVKTGQIHQVPSLFDLCIRNLQKNVDALEYTGGVPFYVLRPVIERCTPHQLLVFEEFNPYLMEECDELWQQHVSRNYRAHKRLENESWREMFLRCQDDQERKLSLLAESIKQSQKIIAAPVRKTQLAFVDSMVKPPRNVQRKQEQFGTKSKLIATPAARVAALSSVTPNAAKTGDVRLRVAASVRDPAQVSNSIRPKKAPLMAKTLQFMRGRHKR